MAINNKDKYVSYNIEQKYHPDHLIGKSPFNGYRERLVVIGSSTGGTEALFKILSKLPLGMPPIVMVQHIPKTFSSSLVGRLDSGSALSVFEVNEKVVLQKDCAYLANGANHIFLGYECGKYVAYPVEGDKISRHKPSVDVLFRSANNIAGCGTLGIILTGMGDDGCIGIKELFDNGAYTIAQSEETCVVFGMPRKAIEVGGVKEIVPLDQIASKIIAYANGKLHNLSKK